VDASLLSPGPRAELGAALPRRCAKRVPQSFARAEAQAGRTRQRGRTMTVQRQSRRPPSWSRHLGRRDPQGRAGAMEHADMEARSGERAAHSPVRDRNTSGDVPLPPAAPYRAARRIAGRGHGRKAEYNASHYRLSVFYDLVKVAVNRLASSQGHELEPYGAIAVAITTGCSARR
jgi:hypothetical protein